VVRPCRILIDIPKDVPIDISIEFFIGFFIEKGGIGRHQKLAAFQ